MLFSTSLILSISSLALAAPLRVNKRQDMAADTNLLVLKFADVLEQLESKFYAQALAKFKDPDFKTAGFLTSQIPIEAFQGIEKDESTHSSVLQSAIKAAGGTPITDCKFDFSSALTDVKTMASTARLVENVGVGAYLGAAPLITDPVLLVAAGSILTVEARHQSILNVLNGASAIPSSFDIALTPSEVLALAGGFISNCDVGVKANPALAISNTDTVKAGTLLKFKADAIQGDSTDGMFCQMMQGGFPFSITQPLGSCVVPEGLEGPVAIWITSDAQPLLNNVRDRATTQLVAGPTMAFIDSKQETLGQLVRGGKGKGSVGTSTATISPAEASAIITKAASSSAAKATATSSSSAGKAKASSTSSSASASKTASATSSSAAKATSTASPTDGSDPTEESLDAILNEDGSSDPTDDSLDLAGLTDSTDPTDDSTDPLAGLGDLSELTAPSNSTNATAPAGTKKPADGSDGLGDLKDLTDDSSDPTDDLTDLTADPTTDGTDPLAGLTDGTNPSTDGTDDLTDLTDDSDPLLADTTDKSAAPSSSSSSAAPSSTSSSAAAAPTPAAPTDTGAGAAPGGLSNDITQSISFTKRMSRRSSMFKREYD